MASSSPEPKWIFGFGSLISNPGFEHSETLQVSRPCLRLGQAGSDMQSGAASRGYPVPHRLPAPARRSRATSGAGGACSIKAAPTTVACLAPPAAP